MQNKTRGGDVLGCSMFIHWLKENLPYSMEQLKFLTDLWIARKEVNQSQTKMVEQHVAPDHVTKDDTVDSPTVEKVDSESSVQSNKSSCVCLSLTENNKHGMDQSGDLPPSKKSEYRR